MSAIRRNYSPAVICLALASGLLVLALYHWPVCQASATSASLALPALQGAAATQYLKEQGLDSSLGAAVNAARGGAVVKRVKSSAATANWFAPTLPLTNFLQQAKLTASDGAAFDNLGVSVAISGDTAVVGAYTDTVGANDFQGSAYVFVRSGTTWTQQAKLTAADGAAGDVFGISVAISGETAVVGASGDDVGANNLQGSSYVFIRSGTTWMQQRKLTATDGTADDQFGVSVAIGSETVVVGAFRKTVGASLDRGSAYVFVRTGTTWTQQAKLTAADGTTNDRFGVSVAISGETSVVGAYFDDSGSAYVFVRNGTTWTQQQKLTGADSAFNDLFGVSVAISGETVVVGADQADVGANTNQGAAYVFVRGGTTWTQQQKLTAANSAGGFNFGVSVVTSGETVVVGADGYHVGTNTFQGAAYVFTRNGTAWTQQQRLTAADGAPSDHFGISVALSGATVVAGAYFDDVGAIANQGSAYVFVDGCSLITLSPATLPSGSLGAPYNQTVTANGGAAPYSFSLSAGALPNGITMSSGGVLSGTPTASGTFNFTVQAADVNGCMGTQAYTFVIGCPVISITPASLPGGTTGTVYNQPLTATAGTPPYTFSVSAGAFPSGITLSSGGVLAGTPTASGTFNFTAKATDAAGCFGTRAYALLINPPGCNTITVNPPTLPNSFIGTNYSQTFTQTGGTGALTWSVSAGALPNGLSLNASTGALSGTLTTVGSFIFTIRITDANNCQGTRQYTVIVSGNGLQFYPLAAPVRLLDTRPGASPNACSQPNLPIAGQTSRTQPGRSICTIPANAVALTGNITTVNSGGGFLTLYPSNAAQPTVASTNYGVNEIINNVFTVGLGADGAFKIFANTTTDVVVDVSGYYAPPGTGGLFFHPLPAPVRLLETRPGFTGCVTPGVPLTGNADSTQQALSACTGIPAAARAIVGNATTVGPQGGGFLTIFPADAVRPVVAASNFNNNQIVNGPFAVGLAPNGQFKIYTTSTTDLVVDVLGYYSTEVLDANGAGLLLTPLAHPVRLLETRPGQPIGCFKPGVPLTGGAETTQTARGVCDGVTIPGNALGVVGNATVVLPSGAGFLTLWPSTAARPLVATSNYNPGDVGNRHFIVGLGNADGAFKMFSSATSHLVIDLSGYFAP